MIEPHFEFRHVRDRSGTRAVRERMMAIAQYYQNPKTPMLVWEDDEYFYIRLPKTAYINDSTWDDADLITDSETGEKWGRSLKSFKINPKVSDDLTGINTAFGTNYDTDMIFSVK